MNQQQFLEYKIKDLKKRKKKLLSDVSKYTMQMAIDELEEVRDFGKVQLKQKILKRRRNEN